MKREVEIIDVRSGQTVHHVFGPDLSVYINQDSGIALVNGHLFDGGVSRRVRMSFSMRCWSIIELGEAL